MPKRSRTSVSSTSSASSDRLPTIDPVYDGPPVADQHPSKYIQTSSKAPQHSMKCSLPPHFEVISFLSLKDFEIHYHQAHANRCSECKRNFPSAHFLDLHIEENHNPLNEARKARGEKIYRCFVEDCEKVCSTPDKRRMHLTSSRHLFPKNYDFFVVNSGVDKRSSMLRSPRQRDKSRPQTQNPEDDEDDEVSIEGATDATSAPNLQASSSKPQQHACSVATPTKSIDDLSASLSSLKFVPPSIRFGRGGRRGGFARS